MYMLLNFKVHAEHDGNLVALEKNEDFPFEIKRVFYIWATAEKSVRGRHAHRKLEQVVVSLVGSCDFTIDNGKERKTISLNSPNQGLYIKPNVWGEFTNFSPDCIVMVLASEHYDSTDYIRDYDDFIKEVTEKNK